MTKDAPPPDGNPDLPRVERLSAWALSGPLTVAVLGLACVQFLTWAPHYVTWPYWADHDVFSNAARAWADGTPPYKETLLNNFPGTIYLFLALGKLVGWGRPWALYAFDAVLLAAFCALLCVWSRRRYARVLPGAVAALSYLSFALGLDYAHAAQRDWHGPAFMAAAILVAQAWSGRGGRVAAGLLAATALAFRPQTALLLPALVLAVGADRETLGARLRALAESGAALGAGLLAAFAPLFAAGLWGEFLGRLKLVRYGGPYNQVTPSVLALRWVLQAAGWRWWVVPGVTALRGEPFASRAWRTAIPWMVALAGVSFYMPLSPVIHTYLDIPIMLVWSVNLAALAGVLLDKPTPGPTYQLAAILLTLCLGTSTIRPEFCVAGPTVRALRSLANGRRPDETPPGYRRGSVPTTAYYPWADYRATLDHLRATTSPRTRVANVLKGDPAIVGMIDRPSAFPAESIAWLRMVDPGDEPRFAAALEVEPDSVVVWVPGEVGPAKEFTLEVLTPVVRRLYEPSKRFGVIEVWTRKAAAGSH